MDMSKHRKPNGNYDGVGIMAELTKLPRSEIEEIAAQVKANSTLLGSCAYHDFVPSPLAPGQSAMRQRYYCLNCGGDVDASAYRWHELGRRPRPEGHPNAAPANSAS